MTVEALKDAIREIGSRFSNREERARRLFLTERPASLHRREDREFSIKTDLSKSFGIPYAAIAFCGSGQLGFSAHKNRLFTPGTSDLDAACIDTSLFQRAWMDVIETTRAFTDLTRFGQRGRTGVDALRDQIVRRGMIRVDAMPISSLSQEWSAFQSSVSLKNADLYKRISIAIYINEYAFCWNQDSAITQILRA